MKKNSKVLITGASGFIGKNLLFFLLKQHTEIAVLDLSNNLNYGNVKKYIGDISDYDFVEKSVLDFQPNKVFHLAGFKIRSSKVEDMSLALGVNLMGTLNLYQSLLKVSSIESIVSLGTTDEYGINNSLFKETSNENPISSYGFSKLCATNLAKYFSRCFNLPITILRPTIVYGPYQGLDMFIPSLINTLILDRDFKMTAGNQIRDFIYISDLIDVMLLVSKDISYSGQVFNVGFGKGLKLSHVAISIAKVLKKESLLKLGSIPYRKNEVMEYNTSVAKIHKKFGWIPKVNLKKGIELTIEYFEDDK